MSAFYNVDQPPFNSRSSARAIAAANNGLLFDPSDMSTMFQDAAGTVPVTAVGQPVGKILDKSGKGNHATQSITASRPTLSARYNLAAKTEVLTDSSVWVAANITVISAGFAANGSQAFKISDIASASSARALRLYQFTITQNLHYCASVLVKKAELDYAIINSYNGSVDAATIVNLSTGQKVSGSGTVTSCGDGWYRISVSFTAAVTVTNNYAFQVGGSTDGLSFSRVGIAGSGIYIASPMINYSLNPSIYQRVNTATDYDTNPAYFPKYLRFDGIDDYLNLPYMGLYAGGGMSIISARDAVSQATDTYIISERSTTDADPKYFPSRQLASGGNMDAYIADDNAAVVLDTVGSPFGGVANAVIRSIVDSGNNLKLFKNGSLSADDNYTRSGTLTLNNTTIGASVSTTTSNYASMKLYGLIVTKSALTDAQRRACERHLSRKAGVTL